MRRGPRSVMDLCDGVAAYATGGGVAAAGGGVTALRTQRDGLMWVSDRDVQIKLPVTLHRRRQPPKVPFIQRMLNISG